MTRPSRLIPSYRKHRSSGQAVCTINGRDHYLGPHSTKASRIEYDRLILEWLASGRSPGYGVPDSHYSIVELAAEYLAHCRSYYGIGPASEYHRVIYVLRPLKQLYGTTGVVEFGVLQFKAVREGLVTAGYSRKGVNSMMKRLVRMFRWAASEGKIPASVPQNLAIVPGLRRGKSEAREIEPVLPVDDATIESTLPYLPEVVADMVRFQRATGARPGEVCQLKVGDLDRSSDVWMARPTDHKTAHHGRQRAIFIGPRAQAVLLKYLARGAEDYCFRPCDSESKRRNALTAARKTPASCGNTVGSNRKGKPRKRPGEAYNSRSYHAAIRRACLRAGLTPWGPNRLRHAAATEVRREFGLEAAQVILGHSQANVTQVYAERDLQKGIEVARRIG